MHTDQIQYFSSLQWIFQAALETGPQTMRPVGDPQSHDSEEGGKQHSRGAGFLSEAVGSKQFEAADHCEVIAFYTCPHV